MSFISDLVNGKEINVPAGGSYNIQAKEGSDVLVLSTSGPLILSNMDVSKLIRALSILRDAKSLEK